MKIEVIELDDDGNLVANAENVVLGDDDDTGPTGDGTDPGGLIVKTPFPDQVRSAQFEPLAGGLRTFAWGRGNREDSYDWEVVREHDTADAAVTFSLSHKDDVPINCNLLITHTVGTTTVQYQHTKCVMQRVTCLEVSGCMTRFQYSVRGGVLTDVVNADYTEPGDPELTWPGTVSTVTLQFRNTNTGRTTDITYDDEDWLVLPSKLKFLDPATGLWRKFWYDPADGQFHEL